uniref:Flotillin n=1 Tax=Kryptolebias marmoratus TaxID=37003 RepID=A0A3Q3AZ24_KRYMA
MVSLCLFLFCSFFLVFCSFPSFAFPLNMSIFILYFFHILHRITLEIMTLQPKCEDVETAEGVAITVTGVAQVKVMVDDELLGYACEQFLGKSVIEIKSVILQTLEGHLRAILGTLTVEQIYQDRDKFATLVREVAAPDVGRMGIEILSFTIKDVYDKVEYLSSLGKTQTAAVQRDADIGVAEAERDAGIREAECKKEMMDVKFIADTKMADSKRELEMQKASFNQEVNTKKAEAQLAYELQAAKEQQKIRLEEIEIEVVQRKKQIMIEEKEIDRTEKELIATVKRPAEAEAYKMQQLAEGQKIKKVLTAQAEAEKIRCIGEAEAASIEAVGKAEAEKMRLKAEAYQQYGDAAKTALVLEALPKVCVHICSLRRKGIFMFIWQYPHHVFFFFLELFPCECNPFTSDLVLLRLHLTETGGVDGLTKLLLLLPFIYISAKDLTVVIF